MWRFCVAVLLGLALVLGSTAEPARAHGPGHNPSRHQFIMQHGVPSEYGALLNPLRMSSENLSKGQEVYSENCAVCHGPTGQSDGESAADLKPTPSRLADMYDRPMAGMGHAGSGGHFMHGMMHHHPGMTHAEAMGGLNLDAYNFWSVSEGGEAMGSSMPAFAQILSENERWQVLLYIANGFTTDDMK